MKHGRPDRLSVAASSMASADRTAATHPTMADRIAAAKVLAAKVMPDLKQIAVDDGGALVQVVLQLGQKVTVSQ